MKQFNKISLCIVSHNRVEHIKKTLKSNIVNNIEYPNLEVIILDYNSADPLKDWIFNECQDLLNGGVLKCYYLPTKRPFTHSITKNIAFNLCTGKIICNINADHFTGVNFAHYVNSCFILDHNIVMTPIDFWKTDRKFNPPNDVLGRLCVKKADFLAIKGFDESIVNYGYEDSDIVNRLEMYGLQRLLIKDYQFLKFIGHDDYMRFDKKKVIDNVYKILFSYLSPSQTQVLILYKNSDYIYGTLIDNLKHNSDIVGTAVLTKEYRYQFERVEGDWISGKWAEGHDSTIITLTSGAIGFLKRKNQLYIASLHMNNNIFRELTSGSDYNWLSIYVYILDSASRMESNLKLKKIIANKDQEKTETVYLNYRHSEKVIF